MKRLLIILAILGLGLSANAQVSKKALGLRVYGDGSFNGAEISFQHRLKTANRLEMDLSFGISPSVNRLFLIGMLLTQQKWPKMSVKNFLIFWKR